MPAPSAQAGIGVLGPCALVATATGLLSVAVGVRSKSTAAGAVMQFPVFLALFAGPVFASEEFQAGWLDRVGAVNPLAHAASRSLLAGTSHGLGSAVVTMVGLITVFVVVGGSQRRRRRLARALAMRAPVRLCQHATFP